MAERGRIFYEELANYKFDFETKKQLYLLLKNKQCAHFIKPFEKKILPFSKRSNSIDKRFLNFLDNFAIKFNNSKDHKEKLEIAKNATYGIKCFE